jgi:hypothetical protein
VYGGVLNNRVALLKAEPPGLSYAFKIEEKGNNQVMGKDLKGTKHGTMLIYLH